MTRISRKSTLSFALLAMMAAPLAFAQETPTDTAAHGSHAEATSWSQVDTDADGSLNMAEAAAVPALAEVFTKADANADGALTGEEYKAYVAQAQAEGQTGTAADAGNLMDDTAPVTDDTATDDPIDE